MKKLDKRKLYKFNQKYITSENIRAFILIVLAAIILIKQFTTSSFRITEFLDTSVLISFITVLIASTIAKWISDYIDRKCEDAEKLTPDIVNLVRKYESDKLLSYNGVKFPEIELGFRKLDADPFSFCINHENKDKRYRIPAQIADHSDWLMNAHKHSTIYNNINVRIDDLKIDDSKLVSLAYSKTTYFDSLITNRVMDFPWPNNKTIREVYEPGPFISPLSYSKLSNHLGFNGFIELSDGNIIFVQRSEHLSIGKGTLGTSIGASFKTKYGLEQDGSLSVRAISNAIRHEIITELRITPPEDEDFSKCIFAFYRDLVEGGKPQFVFFYRFDDYDKDKFLSSFRKNTDSTKADKKSTDIDGTKFEFFTLDELRNASILLDGLETADNKRYPMMPSAAASIAMLLKSIDS